MYEQFFGFRECPFALTPDPRFLFLSAAHREALTNLTYGMAGRKSLTVVIGEVGSGKTTLVRCALGLSVKNRMRCVLLKNPNVTPEQFAVFLRTALGLSAIDTPPWRWCEEIEEHLARRWAAGEGTALIIDEAQSLSGEMFEALRLLTNMETDVTKLLPLLLVGQPELGRRLNEPELRYLKQRVSLRCVLRPLSLAETAAYVDARITVAGGQSSTVFTREGIVAIHTASKGLPRSISVLCDNALLTAFAAGEKPVDSRTVMAVCRDFEYGDSEPLADGPRMAVIDPAPEPGATTPELIPSVPADRAENAPELFGQFQRRRLSIFGAGGR
jgi:type II secretory pathway predicted ATPase ExeA